MRLASEVDWIHVFDSLLYIATSWHGNAFLITRPLWGESTRLWKWMICFVELNYQDMGKLIGRSHNKTKQITKSVHNVWDVLYAPQDIHDFVLFYFVCQMYNFEWDHVIYLSVFVAVASFGTYSMPSHHLNQYWLMVNWTIDNKLQGKFNQNKSVCKKMILKISSVKWFPIWLSLNMEKRLLTQPEWPWADPLLKAALLPRIAIGDNEMTTGITQNGVFINTSRENQKGRHFANAILRASYWQKILVFWSKFHWKVFLWVQLMLCQHWFR